MNIYIYMNYGFGERMDLHTFGFADGEDHKDTIRGEETVSLFSLSVILKDFEPSKESI